MPYFNAQFFPFGTNLHHLPQVDHKGSRSGQKNVAIFLRNVNTHFESSLRNNCSTAKVNGVLFDFYKCKMTPADWPANLQTLQKTGKSALGTLRGVKIIRTLGLQF